MQAVGRADNSPGSEKLRVGAEERVTTEKEEEEADSREGLNEEEEEEGEE